MDIDIRIVAVGGAAGKIMNLMIKSYRNVNCWGEVSYVAIDTDPEALALSLAPNKIKIGPGIVEAYGHSTNQKFQMGLQAAQESISEIEKHLTGASLIVILTALGGAGSGAAGVVASKAIELADRTMGIVSIPFSWEDDDRKENALNGLRLMSLYVDSVLEIRCDQITKANNYRKVSQAFAGCDEIINLVLQGFCGLCLKPGVLNTDFSDVSPLLYKAGPATMGIGTGKGKDCFLEAARNAINSPLFNKPLSELPKVIMAITGGMDIHLEEMSQMVEKVGSACNPEANIVFNYIFDEEMDEEVNIVIIGLER